MGTAAILRVQEPGAPLRRALLVLALHGASAATAATLTVQVNTSADDAEEVVASNTTVINSGDLQLGSNNGTEQLVGMRFTTVNVVETQTICSAWLELTVATANPGTAPYDYEPALLTIQAHADDDAAAIGAADFNLSARPRTAASVAWAPANWTTVGSVQQSPDLTAIVQELIGTHGFAQNDDMVFLIEGAGTRVAESRNGGGAADAPRLHIEYDDDPACGSPTVYEEAVPTNNDDGEEFLTDGTMDRNDNTLELATESTVKNAVGMRFTAITIPRYATINSAFIDFVADEAQTSPAYYRVFGQAVDDAVAFVAGGGNADITGRAATAAMVDWDDEEAWTVGNTFTTPDLASVLQELVDRAGWASGNDVALMVVGTGRRTAESFNGSAANAPTLRIDYTPPAPVIGVVKSSVVVSDPVNGAVNPKRLPGSVIEYRIAVSNSGRISPDAGTVIMTDVLPTDVDLTMATYTASDGCVVSCAGTDGSRPARINDGTTTSALTLDYVSVGDGTDDVEFQDAGGGAVTPPTSGTAPTVRRLVLTPSGTFAANPFGPPYPSFELRYRVRVR